MRRIALFAWTAVALFASIGRADEPAVAETPASVEPRPALTPERLDALMAAELSERGEVRLISDEEFLRRATLDLIGRQPTPQERDAFLADTTEGKRARLVEDLLANAEFGTNWANYWSDTIAYRVSPPELTFLNYEPFEAWLADRINRNLPWNETVQEILAGTGKVKDAPQATFVAYHEGQPTKLASETIRVFLGLQVQCAECHDHPFDLWKREQFHSMAAYFARTGVKMPWNEGIETVVSDKGKGEYDMPNAADPRQKGKTMVPAFLGGQTFVAGKPDVERRQELARLVASADNPWFAKAYVNRVWARLMGRGFYEPVDNIGQFEPQLLPEIHAELTAEFTASNFDVKRLYRLVMNTQSYQQSLPGSGEMDVKPFAAAKVKKLRGDEVFDSLSTAIGLPNYTPPKEKAPPGVRFPPPPKSTRDLVNEAFGFDPSLPPERVTRTLNQAMLLMNNEQIQKQVNAKPDSGTALAQLLATEKENEAAVTRLFEMVLARKPSLSESSKSLAHIQSVGDRGAAFEDLMWALINSTEFTTKR